MITLWHFILFTFNCDDFSTPFGIYVQECAFSPINLSKDITHVKRSPQTCLSSRANVHVRIVAYISLHRSPNACMHAFNHHCSKGIHALEVLAVRYGMHSITLRECQWSTLQIEGNAGLRGSVTLLAAYMHKFVPFTFRGMGKRMGKTAKNIS